jgi:hypothetical protein
VNRTIVIGDLHGCYEEAVELLDRVAACESDRVIFAGDLVDRGPMPRECVELAMQHECIESSRRDVRDRAGRARFLVIELDSRSTTFNGRIRVTCSPIPSARFLR